MVQIGNVPQIIEMKHKLEILKEKNLIAHWELPYENLLTRLDAAIFFLSPKEAVDLSKIWEALNDTPGFEYKENCEKLLSQLPWQVTFNSKNTETSLAVAN